MNRRPKENAKYLKMLDELSLLLEQELPPGEFLLHYLFGVMGFNFILKMEEIQPSFISLKPTETSSQSMFLLEHLYYRFEELTVSRIIDIYNSPSVGSLSGILISFCQLSSETRVLLPINCEILEEWAVKKLQALSPLSALMVSLKSIME